jgi:hypothetical protein
VKNYANWYFSINTWNTYVAQEKLEKQVIKKVWPYQSCVHVGKILYTGSVIVVCFNIVLAGFDLYRNKGILLFGISLSIFPSNIV